MELDVVKKNKSMGLFSFSNNFEVAVNHPKEEVYKQFVSYITKKHWAITSSEEAGKISFQTKMTLISYPIDFEIVFQSIDENSTNLIVSASAGHLDLGRSKKIIDNIIEDINKVNPSSNLYYVIKYNDNNSVMYALPNHNELNERIMKLKERNINDYVIRSNTKSIHEYFKGTSGIQLGAMSLEIYFENSQDVNDINHK